MGFHHSLKRIHLVKTACRSISFRWCHPAPRLVRTITLFARMIPLQSNEHREMADLQINLKHIDQLSVSGVNRQFEQELRCSHAGETGAVWIYRGILATRPKGDLLTFAREHLAGEREHLRFFEQLQGCYRPSFMLPLWRIAGFLTGFFPAIFGRQPVFATIEAVETFVDQHYQEQIRMLEPDAHRDSERAILAGFEKCRLDEIHHRDDAKQRRSAECGTILRLWVALVSVGSKSAVRIARLL